MMRAVPSLSLTDSLGRLDKPDSPCYSTVDIKVRIIKE